MMHSSRHSWARERGPAARLTLPAPSFLRYRPCPAPRCAKVSAVPASRERYAAAHPFYVAGRRRGLADQRLGPAGEDARDRVPSKRIAGIDGNITLVHRRLPPGLSETGYVEGQNLAIEY